MPGGKKAEENVWSGLAVRTCWIRIKPQISVVCLRCSGFLFLSSFVYFYALITRLSNTLIQFLFRFCLPPLESNLSVLRMGFGSECVCVCVCNDVMAIIRQLTCSCGGGSYSFFIRGIFPVLIWFSPYDGYGLFHNTTVLRTDDK